MDSEDSNWEWPSVEIGPKEIKKLMGSALEMAVIFFFRNFTNTFGGEIFLQMFGGPIGARITMCVARLVLQQWRDEYSLILSKAGIEELLSKIYVDDNRNVVKKLKPGLRFDREKENLYIINSGRKRIKRKTRRRELREKSWLL